MIEGYDVKELALGTGDENEYTFPFKIYKATDLLIYMQDDSGEIVDGYPIRGDDTEFLTALTFDTIDGGGTVEFVDDVPDEYTLLMVLAPDDPDQPSSFPNAASFDLNVIEGALDHLASLIQRIFYRAARSIKLHDLDSDDAENPDGVDMMLPKDFQDNPGAVIAINDDGDGFQYGPTVAEIAAAEGYAEAASDSADAAAASAATAAALAMGFYVTPTSSSPWGPGGLVVTGLAQLALASTLRSEIQYLLGSGAVSLLSGSEIQNGQFIGKLLILIGCSATNTVTLVNSATLQLNGDCTLGLDDVIGLVWNGSYWSELFRRG